MRALHLESRVRLRQHSLFQREFPELLNQLEIALDEVGEAGLVVELPLQHVGPLRQRADTVPHVDVLCCAVVAVRKAAQDKEVVVPHRHVDTPEATLHSLEQVTDDLAPNLCVVGDDVRQVRARHTFSSSSSSGSGFTFVQTKATGVSFSEKTTATASVTLVALAFPMLNSFWVFLLCFPVQASVLLTRLTLCVVVSTINATVRLPASLVLVEMSAT